ncbi:FAD-dependent oxidoreductase [Geitlerinema sp. CS-897]|nr:FAD-dependent oxidoreductase [Geitlerinema sp. CS-897]
MRRETVLGLGAIAALVAAGFGAIAPELPSPSQSQLASVETPPEVEPAPTPTPPEYYTYDVVVYGDELPGVCAAIWAKKRLGEGAKVVLVRSQPSEALLGGILTRGGLAYLDFDKTPGWYAQPYSQCFVEFLEKAEVVASCLDAERGDRAMREMLAEAGVSLLSNAPLEPVVSGDRIDYAQITGYNKRLRADSFIDATQQAELAIAAGMPYDRGYESQSPELQQSTLATSIVPVVEGLSIEELRTLEAGIHSDGPRLDAIVDSIYAEEDPRTAGFWLAGFERPLYQAYVDGYYFKSIAIGAAYHLDRGQRFSLDGFFWDKANVCELDEQRLSWNGFLFKYTTDEVRAIEANGFQPTPEMLAEMQHVESWLQAYAGDDSLTLTFPPEVYVRHSISVRDVVDPLSGQEILKGGTLPEKAIGTFSYDFDFRGGVDGLSIPIPPLPQYNFGIEHGLAQNIENLAVTGRSAGYEGIAVSVGRINTANVYHGQGVGVAAAIAKEAAVPLNSITSAQVRQELERLTGRVTELQGIDIRDGIDYSKIR